MNETEIDESAFSGIVSRLAEAGVDSIGALGSTGNYAYLTREERKRVARLAVTAAGTTPVMIGIGSLRTAHVRALAEDAQNAGAAAVLLAPMSYQQLTAEEVFGLYDAVTRELSVPLCVYDNPVPPTSPSPTNCTAASPNSRRSDRSRFPASRSLPPRQPVE
ncbi:dihydrodipicolinate synthase family protein [Rhodococcus jostii]|uniref:dihydrodipicolinate synthase family protein n=1 Tax=Rhodococcus jostii TaxID=132919 RepID=UPI003661DFC1